MNATENIVESYFRLCRNCFTMTDIKVLKGNNRQIDLLAVNLFTNKQYHVEVSVMHGLNWSRTANYFIDLFEKKFFGVPQKREGKGTDHEKGKNYKEQILNTYKKVGLEPNSIKRVWVCWTVNDFKNILHEIKQYSKTKGLEKNPIELLRFRDDILPKLMETVETSNYADEILRTFSLLQQYDKQPR